MQLQVQVWLFLPELPFHPYPILGLLDDPSSLGITWDDPVLLSYW
jgi:hypothetical protein